MSDSNFWLRSRELYGRTLLDEVMPFWMRHGLDYEFGGLGNLLDESGQRIGNDKFLWSQGRALWTFSALYNDVEARPEWLDVARHVYEYIRTHGRDERGYWNYRLSATGEVLDGDISIYVDGFVLNGLAEYYRATGDTEALELALTTWEKVQERLAVPGSYGVAPYIIPAGLKTHGVAMIFSYFGVSLGEIAKRADIIEQGLQIANEILDHFYVPEKGAILEFVTLDGQFVDSPEGRACVPGHAIEALWFLISIFERTGQTARIPYCCELIRRHLELAWDEQYGGLRLALDIDGQTPIFWQKADYKPWWVQVEALVATAYAHHYTGEAWAAEWHERIQSWAFAHYPSGSGEWTQWLDRTGQTAPSAALPVKDPFHLPRGLMVLTELLNRPAPSLLVA